MRALLVRDEIYGPRQAIELSTLKCTPDPGPIPGPTPAAPHLLLKDHSRIGLSDI